MPFLEKVLPAIISNGKINIILDGSVMGRDSACLMASIVYKNRAIPIAWLVVEGSKGHFCEDYHVEILNIIKSIIPDDVQVTVIGDGEFDGVVFLETIEEYDWYFVVRTANNSKFHQNGTPITMPKRLKPSELRSWSGLDFTKELHGPVLAVAWRPDGKRAILYLISNCNSVCEVKQCYKKRQTIETFFSDLKTKGFYLHKSHISDLRRLGNLMIAACIAYIWTVLLGEYALKKGLNCIFHRTDRCDLSLLQLGFRYIEYRLNHDKPIPEINFLKVHEFGSEGISLTKGTAVEANYLI